jgi:hypothetical protein
VTAAVSCFVNCHRNNEGHAVREEAAQEAPAPEPSRSPAVAELMRAEFERQPYRGHLDGGVVGEFVVGKPEPPRPPPPDWDKEERERLERERAAEEKKARKLLADKAKREEQQQ